VLTGANVAVSNEDGVGSSIRDADEGTLAVKATGAALLRIIDVAVQKVIGPCTAAVGSLAYRASSARAHVISDSEVSISAGEHGSLIDMRQNLERPAAAPRIVWDGLGGIRPSFVSEIGAVERQALVGVMEAVHPQRDDLEIVRRLCAGSSL